MRRSIVLAAALAALACKKPSAQPAAPPAADATAGAAEAARGLAAIVASCAAANGTAEVRRAGAGDWQPVATGAVFRAGDVVRTGAGAYARVEFLAGGGLELEENAQVVIDLAPPAPPAPAAPGATAAAAAAPAPAESRVSVEKGVVRGFLAGAPGGGAAASLVIRTADGSDVRLAPEAGGKPVAVRLTPGEHGTELAVSIGQVRILGHGGERTIRSGQAVDLTASGAGEVTELLEFPVSVEPGIDARFRFVNGESVRLAWKPVAGGEAYRVQIARDLSFQRIERTVDVLGTDVEFTPPGEGSYAWRVSTRDSAARLGEYGFARRLFFEREAPKDLLVGPPDGAVVRFSEATPFVAFTWQSAANAQAYRLVLARTADLLGGERVASRATPGQRLEVEGLAPGEYHWGVYVEDGSAVTPIFVKPRMFVVQKVAKPKVKVPRALSEWGN